MRNRTNLNGDEALVVKIFYIDTLLSVNELM